MGWLLNSAFANRNALQGNYPSKKPKALPKRRVWKFVLKLRMFLWYQKTKWLAPKPIDPQLALVSGHAKPLQNNEIAVVVTVRNERKYLPSFLKHYRGLGVSHFIIIDDGSSDGTTDYLKAQADVDLWVSKLRFKEASFGVIWREALMKRYGLNRWYLNIDIDEYLVYDGMSDKTVEDLARHLYAQGCRRMPAPMIDFYPRSSSEACLTDDVMPWEVAAEFDGCGYTIGQYPIGWSVKGGPRRRKFGFLGQLIKHPLIFWDEQCSLAYNIHSPLPFLRNFVPISGVLLHFKFFSDIHEKVRTAIADGQYCNDASAYRRIDDVLRSEPAVELYDAAVSVTYTGPEQLKQLGFIPELWR